MGPAEPAVPNRNRWPFPDIPRGRQSYCRLRLFFAYLDFVTVAAVKPTPCSADTPVRAGSAGAAGTRTGVSALHELIGDCDIIRQQVEGDSFYEIGDWQAAEKIVSRSSGRDQISSSCSSMRTWGMSWHCRATLLARSLASTLCSRGMRVIAKSMLRASLRQIQFNEYSLGLRQA
jgi:hypothetical protein